MMLNPQVRPTDPETPTSPNLPPTSPQGSGQSLTTSPGSRISASRRYPPGGGWQRTPPANFTPATSPRKNPNLTEDQKVHLGVDGVCWICGGRDTGRRLAVDHDHTYGHVRGALCHRCNRAIGLLRDDPAIAQAAADYLKGSFNAYSKPCLDCWALPGSRGEVLPPARVLGHDGGYTTFEYDCPNGHEPFQWWIDTTEDDK